MLRCAGIMCVYLLIVGEVQMGRRGEIRGGGERGEARRGLSPFFPLAPYRHPSPPFSTFSPFHLSLTASLLSFLHSSILFYLLSSIFLPFFYPSSIPSSIFPPLFYPSSIPLPTYYLFVTLHLSSVFHLVLLSSSSCLSILPILLVSFISSLFSSIHVFSL